MKYVLLIMLFVTAPNTIKSQDKGTPKDMRVWQLQSTITMDLSSKPWCEEVAGSIARSARATNTITTRVYCIPKDENDFVADNNKAIQELAPQSLTTMAPLQSLRSRFKNQPFGL